VTGPDPQPPFAPDDPAYDETMQADWECWLQGLPAGVYLDERDLLERDPGGAYGEPPLDDSGRWA
jgi:hypothetical protein